MRRLHLRGTQPGLGFQQVHAGLEVCTFNVQPHCDGPALQRPTSPPESTGARNENSHSVRIGALELLESVAMHPNLRDLARDGGRQGLLKFYGVPNPRQRRGVLRRQRRAERGQLLDGRVPGRAFPAPATPSDDSVAVDSGGAVRCVPTDPPSVVNPLHRARFGVRH